MTKRHFAHLDVDGRITFSLILWSFGVGFAFVGNWLRWEWLAVSAPLPYPDQVWGDRASPNWENALVLVSLALAVLTWLMWWLTSEARPKPVRNPVVFTLASVFKWAAVAVSGSAMVAIVFISYQSMSDWWMLFPSWTAEWFAQLSILVGALALPDIRDPRRSREREKQPRARTFGAAAVVLLVAFPIAVGSVIEGWPSSFRHDPDLVGMGSEDPEDMNEGSAQKLTVFSKPAPFAGAGVRLDSPPADTVWERFWRGARDPALVESIGGGTVAVSLFQATPRRPAFVLLDLATGGIRASLSQSELNRRYLYLRENPYREQLRFTYGDIMLRAGSVPEWITHQGERLPAPPSNSFDESTSQKVTTDGVHAINLVTNETWFIGDSWGCQRRLRTVDSHPMAADGTFVMLQLCDVQAVSADSWSFPPELTSSTQPLSATLFGVDAATGEMVWSAAIPGWDQWSEESGAKYPTSLVDKLPMEFAKATRAETASVADTGTGTNTGETPPSSNRCLYTVTMNGVRTVFDPATGLLEE